MSEDEFNPNSVDAKLATIIANQTADRKAADEARQRIYSTLEKHEAEISKINTKLAWAAGAAAIVGAGVKAAWEYVTQGGQH